MIYLNTSMITQHLFQIKKRPQTETFICNKNSYPFTPDVEPFLADSLVTDLRIEQLPAFVLRTNAAQEFFDSHKAAQPATDLYFDEVLTVAIFPDSDMSSFISKFIVSASTANILNAKIASNEFNLNILGGPLKLKFIFNVYTANITA